MTVINNKFNHVCCNLLLIDEGINKWANRNNIFLIPFHNKYIKFISDVLFDATYSDLAKWLPFEKRTWEDKLKEMSKKGKPDYFGFKIHSSNPFNKKIEFYFIEYKTKGDFLNIYQKEWFKRYYKIPLMIILSTTEKKIHVKDFNKDELLSIKKEIKEYL